MSKTPQLQSTAILGKYSNLTGLSNFTGKTCLDNQPKDKGSDVPEMGMWESPPGLTRDHSTGELCNCAHRFLRHRLSGWLPLILAEKLTEASSCDLSSLFLSGVAAGILDQYLHKWAFVEIFSLCKTLAVLGIKAWFQNCKKYFHRIRKLTKLNIEETLMSVSH